MGNRLTDKEEADFIRYNELIDYIEYVETEISEGNLPSTFAEFMNYDEVLGQIQQANHKAKPQS